MGLTCSDTSPSRKLWIFDTFEGLPAPSSNDPDFELAKDREGDCKGNIDEVRALLGRLNVNCEPVLVKGLFQETIPNSSVKQIAFLHLDGDWYDSTIVCLEHLYDKVATGGIIQIDDYGHWAGARKALHEFLEKEISALTWNIWITPVDNLQSPNTTPPKIQGSTLILRLLKFGRLLVGHFRN